MFTLLDPPKVSSALSLIYMHENSPDAILCDLLDESDCRQFGYESGVEADLIDAVDYLSRGSGNICAQQRIDADDYNVCCICPEHCWGGNAYRRLTNSTPEADMSKFFLPAMARPANVSAFSKSCA